MTSTIYPDDSDEPIESGWWNSVEEADRREAEINLCDLELVLKSGARHKVRVEYHRGHSKNPMTDAEMEEKFRGLANKHLKADRVDALLKQLWSLESLPGIDNILALTRV